MSSGVRSGEFETLTYSVQENLATVTLNRPDKLNAFNAVMKDELLEVMDVADGDDNVRAVIFTGAGRAFCAGADLGRRGATFDRSSANSIPRDGGGQVTLRIFEMSKPTIAAINGAAVGVGLTMTLPMDVRLSVPDAKLGFVFARRGLAPEACSSWFLPRIVGISQAAQWCYSGRIFRGAEAAAANLVTLAEPEDLVSSARRLAADMTEHSAPVSVAVTRKLLWQGLTFNHPMESHRADSRAIHALGASADAVEGVESFLDKRPPRWAMAPSSDSPDVMPWVEKPTFS